MLGVVACEGSAAEMLAMLRRTLWPSPFRHLALCSLMVADELLELFAVVLERNRFHTEQLPACEQRPRQRNHLNLSNTLIRSTSNLNDFHFPSIFSCNRTPTSMAFAFNARRPSRPRICSTTSICYCKLGCVCMSWPCQHTPSSSKHLPPLLLPSSIWGHAA